MADESPAGLDWQQLLEEALTAPGGTGNVYNRFHEYSFLNQVGRVFGISIAPDTRIGLLSS
jgi:hypothetical protein